MEINDFSKMDNLFSKHQDETYCLSPRNEEMIKFVYGLPNDIPVEEEPIAPPSPNTSIKKAALYVIKETKNGFLPSKNISSNPEEIYAHIINPMREESNEQAFRSTTNKNISTTVEPYQQYWFSSETVQKVRKEIRSIRIKDKSPLLWMEEKFNEQAMNIVRVMKHLKMVDCEKTRKKLNGRMKYFINEITRARKDIFVAALTNKNISYNDLNDAQKKEFIQFKPKEEKQKQVFDPLAFSKGDLGKHEEVEAKVYQAIEDNLQYLPPNYRFENQADMALKVKEQIDDLPQRISEATIEGLNKLETDHQRPMTTNLFKNTKQSIKVPFRRKTRIIQSQMSKRPPKSIIPNAPIKNPKVFTKEDVYNEFWSFSDPLIGQRNGTFLEPSTVFNKMTSAIDVDLTPVNETPYTIPDALNRIPDPDTNRSVCTQLLKTGNDEKVEDYVVNDSKQASKFQIKLDPSVAVVLAGVQKHEENIEKAKDMEYLLNQTVELTKDNEISGKLVFKRLEAVWNRMGFSTMQKLDMAIKYSKNAEESSRLAESLDFWENAESVVNRYNKAYSELKDFLEFEVTPPLNKGHPLLRQLIDEFNSSADFLFQIYDQMKGTIGDELIIDRMKVTNIIPYRKSKVQALIDKLSVVPQ